LAAAGELLAFAVDLVPSPEPATRSAVVPCQVERSLISQVQADQFRSQTLVLNLVEINDAGLSNMVCTPHLLPRSLFFKKPCPCSGDDADPTADELAAFRDETRGPAAEQEEDAEPSRDLRADLAEPDLYDHFGTAVVNNGTLSTVSFQATTSPDLASGLASRVVNIHQDFLANPHYDINPARFVSP